MRKPEQHQDRLPKGKPHHRYKNDHDRWIVKAQDNGVVFTLLPGQSLVIRTESSVGLERIYIEVEKGKKRVRITARGQSDFEFGVKGQSTDPDLTDFLLSNPDLGDTLQGYVTHRFWGQFNFGEAVKLREARGLHRKVDLITRRSIHILEGVMVRQLNSLSEVQELPRFKTKKRS